jgi:1,4-alpha-glucan branching enzyme
MNKGKSTGSQAGTRTDAGIKSSSRPRKGQAGAGLVWTYRPPRGTKISQPIQFSSEQRTRADRVETSFNGDGKVKIAHFEFHDSEAHEVCLAGTFNDWHPAVSVMIPMGNGQWKKDLLLKPGEYEYRFVVDGKWVTDSNSVKEHPNGFGENNSVLVVS